MGEDVLGTANLKKADVKIRSHFSGQNLAVWNVRNSRSARPSIAIIIAIFCLGCTHTHAPYIQAGIRIVPPVTRDGYDAKTQTTTMISYNDGGTKLVKITDATGQKFDVYTDHRIDTMTPGAIYLLDYPGKSNSVPVIDPRDFKKKIGDFE